MNIRNVALELKWKAATATAKHKTETIATVTKWCVVCILKELFLTTMFRDDAERITEENI